MAAKVVKTTKKTTAVSPKAKTASSSKVSKSGALPKYKELITEAIVSLAERGGSSRQALKSFIKEKYPVGENFDTQFNLAVKRGLETEFFSQPKGPAGSIRLVKKPKAESKKAASPEAKKSTTVKKPSTSTKKSSAPASTKKTSNGKVSKKDVTKKAAAKKASDKKTPAKKTPVKKSKKN